MKAEGERSAARAGGGRAAARRLAWLLDNSIRLPGGYRIGIDGIIGLIPGIGDAAGLVMSSFVLLVALGEGVSVATIARMVANVLLETLIGAVPIVGDLFDFAWKANTRNVALLDGHLAQPDARRRRDVRYWLLVPLAVLAVFALAGVLCIAIAVAAWRLLFG